MAIPTSNLRIDLLDNACHSLQRGYEMLNQGRTKKDALLLKEAIIWIHHGVELSLKQLLVQSNEYLVFENVDEAVRKLAHLRRQPDMFHATVLDLFDYGESVYTVGFSKLVERVSIILNFPELATGSPLRRRIDELTNYRNRITHFAVEVRLDEVVSLLADLMEPFLTLLEREIRNEVFVQRCIPYVRANAESVTAVYHLKYMEIEKRITQLTNKFNGQQVPGELFGLNDPITLPKFCATELQTANQNQRVDIVAQNDSEAWLVEIKFMRPNFDQFRRIVYELTNYREKFQTQNINTKLWLIIMEANKVFRRSELQQYQILFSSEKDIIQLEQLLT